MTILHNFKSRFFWLNVLKLGTIFFILFILITLAISHFAALISGDFNLIYATEWANGKWKEYFLIRLAISFVYAIYMVSRKMGRDKKRS